MNFPTYTVRPGWTKERMLELIDEHVPDTPRGSRAGGGYGRAVYIGPGGCACAIAALVPTELWPVLGRHEGCGVDLLPGRIRERLPLDSDALRGLQHAHDMPVGLLEGWSSWSREVGDPFFSREWAELSARERSKEWVRRFVAPVRSTCGHEPCSRFYAAWGEDLCVNDVAAKLPCGSAHLGCLQVAIECDSFECVSDDYEPNGGPVCGHSACSQHYIDTGSAACVDEGGAA